MIAIWGANGFIGRHLTRLLVSTGSDIKLFSRDFEGFPFSLPDSIQKFEYDFSMPDNYIEHMSNCHAVVLLVSASLARTFVENPEQEITKNIVPYRDFFNSLEKQKNELEHIVFLSSGGTVYGVTDNYPVSEDHPATPISPYGKAKLAIENHMIEYARNAKWDYSILRAANPVGVWHKKTNLVNAALNAVQTDDPLTIWNGGKAVRDYFDVKELVQAIKLVIEKPETRSKIFNVGSGKGYTVNEVIDIVGEAMGKPVPAVHKYQHAQSNSVRYRKYYQALKDLPHK